MQICFAREEEFTEREKATQSAFSWSLVECRKVHMVESPHQPWQIVVDQSCPWLPISLGHSGCSATVAPLFPIPLNLAQRSAHRTPRTVSHRTSAWRLRCRAVALGGCSLLRRQPTGQPWSRLLQLVAMSQHRISLSPASSPRSLGIS